ncbi:MAG: tetratricopeptide repeat protein [bacterium]|nr:tetratricopeptide repeat protein [bacterium]
MTKRRITRRELKEDKLREYTKRLTRFFYQQDPKRVKRVSYLFLAVIAGILVIFSGISNINKQCLFDLSRGLNLYYQSDEKEKKGYKEAKVVFSDILSDYPLTRHRMFALFYKANCHYHLEEYKEASDCFQEFVRRYPSHPLAPFSLQNLAEICEIKKDYKEGLSVYKDIIKDYPKGSNLSFAYLGMARCFERLGRWSEAKKAYQDLIKNCPKSRLLEEAKFFIATIDKRRSISTP